jgi:hypothetical protein
MSKRSPSLRPPAPGETPLSPDEICLGVSHHLIAPDDDIDLWPVQQRWLGVGQWSIPPGPLAHPFAGLIS